ncbi:hypothetical protein [Parvicella tangerina]|uniref:Lipoprotein n=1 Tax=Parvicella tangerina TaxID=2829795 RepID=A0A916JNM0_9FLAO|nr:hypothetical protein [Parvicella tangerina]CAG5083204.1 hypothetical protein CRYO30217_02121 [Parvicella tangerina]
MKTPILITSLITLVGVASCEYSEQNTIPHELSNTPKATNLEDSLIDSLYLGSADRFHHLTDLESSSTIDTVYSVKKIWSDDSKLNSTHIYFKNFDVVINSFFISEKLTADTIIVMEDVGEYLNGRRLKIIPKNVQDTFHLSIRVIDEIHEMMDSDSLSFIGDWDTWQPLMITDTSDYFYWKPFQKNKYYFPSIVDYNGTIMQRRIKELNFRDTMYWYHGEMSGTYYGPAWLYNGHIVEHYVFTAFVMIERHNNGLQERKWLKLEFSYGC